MSTDPKKQCIKCDTWVDITDKMKFIKNFTCMTCWKKEKFGDPEGEIKSKITWAQNKDKRISFLSIFSSLCNYYDTDTHPIEDMSTEAFALVSKLYETYSYPKKEGDESIPFVDADQPF